MVIKEEFKILNWNIGGAKYLESDENERAEIRNKINSALTALINRYGKPDVITLQEVVSYVADDLNKDHHIIDKEEIEKEGYIYTFFPLIDTIRVSNRDKWDKVIWKYNCVVKIMWDDESKISEEDGKKLKKFLSILLKKDLNTCKEIKKDKDEITIEYSDSEIYSLKFDKQKGIVTLSSNIKDFVKIDFNATNKNNVLIICKHKKGDKCHKGHKISWEERWPKDTYFAQGNSFIVKKDLKRHRIWDLTKVGDYEEKRLNWEKALDDNSRDLREFLSYTINVKLEENTKVIREYKDKIIKVEVSANDSISLELDDNDTKVILKRNGAKTNEFKAKKEEDGLNIYEKDDHLIEQVNLDSGLYFGDRDTEPRAALIAHLIKNPKRSDGKLLKPLDIFVINVHLTTIMKEREGIPKKDKEATEIRLDQLKTIFDGIISRYNLWKASGFLNRGEERYFDNPEEKSIKRYQPIWIIAGDFNFTPESLEYEVIKRMNFVDVVPNKGSGTKSSGRGNKASLTLDYIFAGPNFISLDPFIIEKGIDDNEVDHQTKASDHYPIWATIPIEIKEKDEDSEKNPCSNKADSDASENQTESKKDDKP